MATGLLRPDAGWIQVDGVDVWRDPVAVKRRVGVVPEGLRLFERLTGSYRAYCGPIPFALRESTRSEAF